MCICVDQKLYTAYANTLEKTGGDHASEQENTRGYSDNICTDSYSSKEHKDAASSLGYEEEVGAKRSGLGTIFNPTIHSLYSLYFLTVIFWNNKQF